jgi:two-component system, NarL family, sensor histidine kinase DesK
MTVLLTPRLFRIGRLFMAAWGAFFILPIYVVLTAGSVPVRERALIIGLSIAIAAAWIWFSLAVVGSGNRILSVIAVATITLLVAIIGALTPPMFSTFFIFAAVAAGASFGWRPAIGVVVAITILALGIDAFRGSPPADLISEFINDLLGGLTGVAGRLVIGAYLQLAEARSQIAQLAVDEERLRFARDLHDLLGHSLSVIALKSELAGRLLLRAPGLAAHEVTDIEKVARDALREVREAVAGYRQPTLAAEIAGARAALTAANIEVSAEAVSAPMPPAVEAVLAWTVREAATNVIRHSRATRCAIRVIRDGDRVGVEVIDNGPAPTPGARGSGLDGLAERVDERGGQIDAGPLPHEGYRLRVLLPLRYPAAEPAPEDASRSA